MKILLAQPRGFCAGVDRAIAIVEEALNLYGAPVYVRHEIVHNKYVVDDLRSRGAVFVEELSDIPDGGITVFSAHGVSEAVENEAKRRNLPAIDATCPLVTKVHIQAQRAEKQGKDIILIGHEGHPEVEGTSGRVERGVFLVQDVESARTLQVPDPERLSFVTQTTLSVNDTKDIIAVLKERFPAITGPGTKDICYATQNRQDAIEDLADRVDVLLVVGSKNSSNSNRLRDLGVDKGIPSWLVDDASAIDIGWLKGANTIGISAGASAPDVLVQGVVEFLKEYDSTATVELMDGITEDLHFKLPKQVREPVYANRKQNAVLDGS